MDAAHDDSSHHGRGDDEVVAELDVVLNKTLADKLFLVRSAAVVTWGGWR